MPRYGGNNREDFKKQAAELREFGAELTEVEAKEAVVTDATETLGTASEKTAGKRRELNQAKKEGADFSERAAAAEGQEAKAVDVTTDAIRRNAEARARRAAIAEREAVNAQRAFRGAQDPLFAQARAVTPLTQYELRRTLGIGQGRAANLQAAARSIPDPNVFPGAQTRVQAADRAIVQADIDLADAKKRYTASVKAGDLAAGEAARADQLVAEAARVAAKSELELAQNAIALAEARRIEAARLAEEAVVHGGPPVAGTGLIPHPTMFQGGRYVQTTTNVEQGIAEGVAATKALHATQQLTLAHQAEAEAAAAAAAAEGQLAASQQIESAAALAKSNTAAAAAEAQMAARVERNIGALTQEGVAFNTVSQAMHKHGALTSEFILAAARGETTLRELGNQAVITAGKFGGWTAAATGLFAAAGAIGKIGQGAMQASGGVHTLQRVITDGFDPSTAQTGFADLAKEFNVPIETVVDAVYRMGQRFHTLPQAMEAARSALYSFKTGEVDVATSTENLLAIVNGFGLQSSDLARVYDQINQAQNTFGIRIGDTEAGLAKAAGTYRNAGGDLNYLLGLTVAISRATNRSGQEIGTGIARGVNEIRKSVNQAKLEAQGVDVIPDNFQKTLQNALKVARDNPNADRQQLASGLFGNQYARLIAPVLRDQRVLNAALKDTSPEKSKGSAQQELAKVLSQADEQIKRVGISLQRLGAALAEAGAFHLAGALLEGLNSVLDLAVKIVDVFNKIPEPFRSAITVAGELMVTMRLLQRFGATAALRNTPFAFLDRPDQRIATRARAGLRGARDAARDEAERTGRAAYSSASVYGRAEAAAATALDEKTKLVNSGTATDEELIAANDRLIAANARAERAEERYVLATEEALNQRIATAAAEREYTAATKLGTKEMAARARTGLPTPVLSGAPNTAGVHGYRVPPAAQANMEELQRLESEAAGASGALERSGGLTKRAQNAMYGMAYSWEKYGAWTRKIGPIGETVDRAAGGTIRATSAAISGMERAAGGVKAVGGSLLNLVKGFGPLEIGLLSYFALDALGGYQEKYNKQIEDAAKQVQRTPHSASQMAQHRRLLEQRSKLTGETAGETFRHATELLNPANLFSDITGIGGYQSPYERRVTQVTGPAKQELANLNQIRDIQAKESAKGRPRTQLLWDQLTKDIDRDQKDRAAGLISQHEFDRSMATHYQEINFLYYPSIKDINAVRRAYANAQRESGSQQSYRASLRKLDTTGLSQQVEDITQSIKFFGSTTENMTHLREAFTAQVKHLMGSTKPEDIQALNQARDAYFKAISESVQADLQAAQDGASEDERRAAYVRASQTTARDLVGRAQRQLQQARQRVTQARANAARSRADFRSGPKLNELPVDAQDALGLNALGQIPAVEKGGDINTLRRAARQDAAHVKELMRQRSAAHKELTAAIKQNNDAQRALRDASYQDRAAGRQIDLSLQQSATNDPVQAARDAVVEAQKNLADAIITYGTKGREFRIALAAVNDAFKALGQTIKQASQAAADAADDLAAARAGDDPIAQARAAQRKAGRALRGADNTADRRTALAGLVRANNQMEQAVRDREVARLDLLESTITDPVAQAHNEVRKAQAALAGTQGTARLTAQAALNRARQSARDAELQAREGDIDFEQTMGQVSNAQAISAYQRLLQIRNLTKQQRRDILLKIHQLKQDSESEASGFDLDVGPLKLPTIYDIRRAFDPVRRQVRDSQHAVLAEAGAQSAHIRNNVSHMYQSRAEVQANVTVIVRDKNAAGEVFSAIDRALGTTLRARMRSHRLRGAA